MAGHGPYMQTAEYRANLQALGLLDRAGKITSPTKVELVKQLRIKDEQQAINRYKWYNLPNNITSQELERMLYYRGQLAFVYLPETDELLFLPYTLASDNPYALDWYGRYKQVRVVPFGEGTTKEEKSQMGALRGLLSTKLYNVKYGQQLWELSYDDAVRSAVLIKDYTNQEAQKIIPRSQLQDSIIGLEADCLLYMHTALKNGTGITGVRVSSDDETSNIYKFVDTLDLAALEGDTKIPIKGALDFQELTGGSITSAQDFLLAAQAIDNYRLSLLGCTNGGLFEKSSHILQSEQAMNTGIANVPLQDGLKQRQDACMIINSIFPLGIWCEIEENQLGIDRDGDMESSENDPELQQPQPQEVTDNE